MIEINEAEEGKAKPEAKAEGFTSIIVALCFLLLLISQGEFDPTPANLVASSQGVSNLFGLGGSLFAGLFFDLFGLSIWALVAGWLFLKRKTPKSLANRFFLSLLLFVAFNYLLALVFALQGGDVGFVAGLLGVTFEQEIAALITPWPGLIIFLLFLVFCVPLFQLDLTLVVLCGFCVSAAVKGYGVFMQKLGLSISQAGVYYEKIRGASFQKGNQRGISTATKVPKEENIPAPEKPDTALHQALEAYKKQSVRKNSEN